MDSESVTCMVEKINLILNTELTNEIIDKLIATDDTNQKKFSKFLNPYNIETLQEYDNNLSDVANLVNNELNLLNSGSIFSIVNISNILNDIQINIKNYKEFKIYRKYFEYFDFIMLTLKSFKDQFISINKEINQVILSIIEEVFINASNKSLITFLLCLKHYKSSSFTYISNFKYFKFPMIEPLLYTILKPLLRITVKLNNTHYVTELKMSSTVLLLKLKEILDINKYLQVKDPYTGYERINSRYFENDFSIFFQLNNSGLSEKKMEIENLINSNQYKGEQQFELQEYLDYLNWLPLINYEERTINPLHTYSNISFVNFRMGFQFVVISDLFTQDVENYTYPLFVNFLNRQTHTVLSFL